MACIFGTHQFLFVGQISISHFESELFLPQRVVIGIYLIEAGFIEAKNLVRKGYEIINSSQETLNFRKNLQQRDCFEVEPSFGSKGLLTFS